MIAVGRAGRMRVERRLQTARHGAELLNRKQQILAEELDRLELQCDALRELWERLSATATVWLRRAVALDGLESIGQATPVDVTTVTLTWGGSMGLRYPVDARCNLAIQPPCGGSSALSYAVASYRHAVSAGVHYAAVRRGLVILTDELAQTRLRQHSIENRWIPRLESELDHLRHTLDEQEREESLRVRWAADNHPRAGG